MNKIDIGLCMAQKAYRQVDCQIPDNQSFKHAKNCTRPYSHQNSSCLAERLPTAASFLNPRFSRFDVHENRRCCFILYISFSAVAISISTDCLLRAFKHLLSIMKYRSRGIQHNGSVWYYFTIMPSFFMVIAWNPRSFHEQR